MPNVTHKSPVNFADAASVVREPRNHVVAPGYLDSEPAAHLSFAGGPLYIPGAAGVADQYKIPLKNNSDTVVNYTPMMSAGNSVLSAHMTLGPWFLNDVPGTATTEMLLAYFNTTSAIGFGGANENDFTMPVSGQVIGAFLMSDDARTAGTATLVVRINTVATTFVSGAVALDGTNTQRVSTFVPGSGLSFSEGDEIGVALTTASWTPTTANATAWLLVRLGG